MNFYKTFEAFNSPYDYNIGDEIVVIQDYDDKIKRGAEFKITNIDGDMITITNDNGVIAEVSFDGDIENYFKKSHPENVDVDPDIF